MFKEWLMMDSKVADNSGRHSFRSTVGAKTSAPDDDQAKRIKFQLNPANRKSAFIALTSFQSLFLVNFQVSAWNESHHFLVKLSCESVPENVISARSAVCLFQPILQLNKESSWPSL